jgi:fluoride exporter
MTFLDLFNGYMAYKFAEALRKSNSGHSRRIKTKMVEVLFVGAGGFLGAIGRYLLAGAVYQLFPNSSFPSGTAVVNILGCFLIGLLNGLFEVRQVFGPETRLFLLIGVLGGFTTFSTFGFETLALMKDGEFLSAAMNVLVQVVLGLAAVFIGYSLLRPT